MIIEIDNERDLEILENDLCTLLNAQRPDVGLLRSTSYVKFKLDCLKKKVKINHSVHFFQENVWIRVLEIQPKILLYCGLKELDYDNIKFMQDSKNAFSIV